MARATATAVSYLFLGTGTTFPPGVTATTVGNTADLVDDELDELGFGSDAGAVRLANQLTYRRIIHGQWAIAGGTMSGYPEPVIWTSDMMEQRKNLQEQGTYEYVASVDTVED